MQFCRKANLSGCDGIQFCSPSAEALARTPDEGTNFSVCNVVFHPLADHFPFSVRRPFQLLLPDRLRRVCRYDVTSLKLTIASSKPSVRLRFLA
jgi:hypothetical protein